MKKFFMIICILIISLIVGCAGENGADGISGTNGTNGTDGADGGAFGLVTFDKSTYQGTILTASITLTDANLTVASISVTVTSTSDPVGISIPLTGSNGQYTGSVGFTKSTSGSGKIKVADGNTITINYNDTNPAGLRTFSATWIDFVMNPTGVVTFENDSYFGLTSTATLTLLDSDLTAASVNVNVKSTSDAAGITVALTGSGGVYSGTVGFTSSTSGSGKIRVADGDTVTLTYNDTNPAGSRTDTTIWQTNTHGIVFFNADLYSSGLYFSPIITVVDADISGTSVDVNVKSTSDNTGITVTLKEEKAGVYTGSVGLTNNTSGSGKIKVFNGDFITVSYNEVAPAGTRTDMAKFNSFAGYVGFGASSYNGYIDEAIISITDFDLVTYNVTTGKYEGPIMQNVNIKSTSDTTGITVPLYQNTLYYQGCVGFTSGTSGDGKIKVSAGDTITVTYIDESPSAVKTATATWNP